MYGMRQPAILRDTHDVETCGRKEKKNFLGEQRASPTPWYRSTWRTKNDKGRACLGFRDEREPQGKNEARQGQGVSNGGEKGGYR
jgi:hypothetical protein